MTEPLTVRQLIEQLQQHSPNMRVSVGGGCCGDKLISALEVRTCNVKKDNSYVAEQFYPEFHEPEEDDPLETILHIG